MLTASARAIALTFVVVACSTGCGSRSGLLVDDPGDSVATADPGPSASARIPDAPILGTPVDAAVAATLDGLRWELPCTTVRDPMVCFTPGTRSVSATMGGEPGVTYEVSLRFRGVVELSQYESGSNDGSFWQVGGNAPSGSVINVYGLTISSPPQTYYLNRGVSQRVVVGIDYPETVAIDAGATVTLLADSRDELELRNVDGNGQPIVPFGVPPAPAAFDGQFVQMDVTSVRRP